MRQSLINLSFEARSAALEALYAHRALMEQSRATLRRARALCAATDELLAGQSNVAGASLANVIRDAHRCVIPECSRTGRFKPYFVARRSGRLVVIRDVLPPLCGEHRAVLDAIFRGESLESLVRELHSREREDPRAVHVMFEVIA